MWLICLETIYVTSAHGDTVLGILILSYQFIGCNNFLTSSPLQTKDKGVVSG